MKRERILAMTLSAAMLLSANAAAATASDFSDFPSGWSAEALNHAIENGLLQGTDGKIYPEGLVTRAQMSAIVTRALGVLKGASLTAYRDVAPDAWYAEPMGKAVAMGAFRGEGGQLRPEAPINRQEAFNVLARIFSLEDGNTDILRKYADYSQLSDWAKPGMAAMVQAGYVEGNGNQLNPKATMTRAELAQVMDRMVTAYLTGAADETVPEKGSVVLRGDQTLRNAAIQGDLIVGDGAENVQLQQVTVSGRILIRGGGRNVTISGCKAQGGVVVDHPGEPAVLTVSNGDPGTVTVKSDVRLHGTVQQVQVLKTAQIVVEKGSSVHEILVKAKNVGISGDGRVDQVYTEADNTVVTTTGTTVKTGTGVSGTMAGGSPVKPGDSAAGNSGSTSGHGSGQVAPPNVDPAPDQNPQQNKLVEEAKIVDLGWSRYLTVRFADGKNLENTTLSVDGVAINGAATPVAEDGSIVKWEVTSLDHASLEAATGNARQTVSLGSGKGAAPTVKTDTAPDYFLLNGPVYIWDYHLTNYDAAGNVRVAPGKTTFNLSGKTDRIPGYSPDAVLYADAGAENVYHVRGTVELMFNYAEGTEAEKNFVNGITDVDLVSFDENQTTLNKDLQYKINHNFAHGSHTVACIEVPLGQANFFTHGRYKLRVTSNGKSALYPIHVVQEKVPSLTYLNSNDGNVRFRVKDMTYGITSPIYRVDLTDASGRTETLEKFDDWFLIGDMLVIYNDKTSHFPTDGNYTVTVYADGFQRFTKQFFQKAIAGQQPQETKQQQVMPRAVTVDAVSSASLGGGGSEGGSGGGGSKVMNANLVVDADLMVNAQLLCELGIPNKAAEGIADRWNMNKLYVFQKGAAELYTAEGYFDAVNTARTEQKYLTFSDYLASGQAETTQNRPGSVKQILEDNLLGLATNFRDMAGVQVPALTLLEQTDGNVVFSCTDEAYLSKLADEGALFLNTTYPPLDRSRYAVEEGRLTVKGVKIGRNTLMIRVPTYQMLEVTFDVEKQLEEFQLSAEDVTKGEPIVVVCAAEQDPCDFLAHLTGVKLVAPNGAERVVRRGDSESLFKELGYTVEGRTLTIGKDILDEAFAKESDGSFQSGRYSIVLTAEHYEQQTVEVMVEDQEEQEPDAETQAPAVQKLEKDFFGDYRLIFGYGQDPYIKAITAVTVNDTAYATGFVNNNTNYSTLATDGILTIGNNAFRTDGKNVVVITATGYAPLTLTIENGKLTA